MSAESVRLHLFRVADERGQRCWVVSDAAGRILHRTRSGRRDGRLAAVGRARQQLGIRYDALRVTVYRDGRGRHEVFRQSELAITLADMQMDAAGVFKEES